MAYLSAVSSLDSVVQWEINDPGQTTGGAGGGANAQAQALLNRVKYYTDGTYKAVIASAATNLNAVTPTQAGITDANAIAAATGTTLAARLFSFLAHTGTTTDIGVPRDVHNADAGTRSFYPSGFTSPQTGTWLYFFMCLTSMGAASQYPVFGFGADSATVRTVYDTQTFEGFSVRIA